MLAVHSFPATIAVRSAAHATLRPFRRSTTVTSSDGREFKLTPDLLTIEKKTFKQSSEPRTHILRVRGNVI